MAIIGIFDFFKRPSGVESSIKITADNAGNVNAEIAPEPEPQAEPSSFVFSVPEEEKPYYRPMEYYTEYDIAGHRVIPFEERKRISVPSARGLYVAELLLLQYCSYGTYPHPKRGYPGFWWFEYGIQDVGAVLASLEKRGFIELVYRDDIADALTVPQLKELLKAKGQPLSGKKAELALRVYQCYTPVELSPYMPEPKYVLTKLGAQELADNAYVPHMHSAPDKTNEDKRFGPPYNVWEVNRRLEGRPLSDQQQVVDEVYHERYLFLNRNR